MITLQIQAKIPEGDPAIYEDELLSKVVDIAVRYDCLNIVNLASFEMIIRRKQLLAEAHVGNPSAHFALQQTGFAPRSLSLEQDPFQSSFCSDHVGWLRTREQLA